MAVVTQQDVLNSIDKLNAAAMKVRDERNELAAALLALLVAIKHADGTISPLRSIRPAADRAMSVLQKIVQAAP